MEEEKIFHHKSPLMQKLMETEYYRQKFAYQEERWVPQGDNTCPLCNAIADLEWLPFGTLPAYKKAHSTLGEGRWKAPDSSCQCTKAYKRTSGDYPGPMKLVYNPNTESWRAESFNKFDKVTHDKIVKLSKIIKENKCTCK